MGTVTPHDMGQAPARLSGWEYHVRLRGQPWGLLRVLLPWEASLSSGSLYLRSLLISQPLRLASSETKSLHIPFIFIIHF